MTNRYFIHYLEFAQLPTIGVEIFPTNERGLQNMLKDERKGEIRIISIEEALDNDLEHFKDITAEVYMALHQ